MRSIFAPKSEVPGERQWSSTLVDAFTARYRGNGGEPQLARLTSAADRGQPNTGLGRRPRITETIGKLVDQNSLAGASERYVARSAR
jgi:hypothetical protein